MTSTIIIGQAESLSATVQVNGAPLAINTGSTVNARLVSLDGQTILAPDRACVSSAAGANWALGIVVAVFTNVETGALTAGPDIMMVLAGPGFVKRFLVHVEQESVVPRSLLFIRDIIVDELRSNHLVLIAQSYFPGITLTDDFIWSAVQSAEAEMARRIRAPLVPTQFFPLTPDQDTTGEIQEKIDALPPTMPFDFDAAYDYDPDFFTGEKWGFLALRKKPLITVSLIRFVYPAPTTGFYDVPGDWLRIDNKYAHIRLVPASSPFVAPLNAFILQALGGGRTIPFAMQITYVAGITNAAATYPEMIDAIKKMAVLKILENGFFPKSGSIGADGLTESMSIDMQNYRDMINVIIDGPPKSNGGLVTAIHGIRGTAFGQGP